MGVVCIFLDKLNCTALTSNPSYMVFIIVIVISLCSGLLVKHSHSNVVSFPNRKVTNACVVICMKFSWWWKDDAVRVQDKSWRVRYMVANQLYELCAAVGPEPTRWLSACGNYQVANCSSILNGEGSFNFQRYMCIY